MTAPPTNPAASHRRKGLPIAAAVPAAAFTLPPPLSSVGPLLSSLITETGLSTAGAAVLTTLPVLCLGAGAGLGPWIMRQSVRRSRSFPLVPRTR